MKLIHGSIVLILTLYLGWVLQASANEPIKIAAIFAKTGVAAISNKPHFEGIALAVEAINRGGGLLNRPVEIIQIDNKSTPLGSEIAALEAIDHKVTAVIGASWSSHSLVIAPIFQKAQIPMITPTSTHPQVTQAGDFIFRVCFLDSAQGQVMAQFAHQDLQAKRAMVLKNIHSEYSVGLADFFKQSFTHWGGQILGEGHYKEKAIDFTPILQQVQKLQPDIVYLPGYERDSGFLIKQARDMGIQARFLGGDGWSEAMYDYGDTAIDENYFTNHWHTQVTQGQHRSFHQAYQEKYGRPVLDNEVPLAYDAMNVLADAIQRVSSLAPQKIKKALQTTQDFQGITGTLTFNHHGDPIHKEVVILKFSGGNAEFVKRIQPQ